VNFIDDTSTFVCRNSFTRSLLPRKPFHLLTNALVRRLRCHLYASASCLSLPLFKSLTLAGVILRLLRVPWRRAGVALRPSFKMALTVSYHTTCGKPPCARWVGGVHRFDFPSQLPCLTIVMFAGVQAPAPLAAALSKPWPCWPAAPCSQNANALENRWGPLAQLPPELGGV